MIIHGMTVCVGYEATLRRTLGRWMKGLTSLTIVGDLLNVSWSHSLIIPFHTNAFYEGGRTFGKSNAMQEAWESKPRWFDSEWHLFFDADVLPPENWYDIVKAANPQPGNLYGARRVGEDGKPVIFEREIAGYFQLFHGSDPLVKGVQPLLDTSWTHAGGYDSVFQNKWPAEKRHFLPLTVTHLGEPFNWYGTGPDARAKMDALLQGWKKHGHGNVPGERVV